MADHKIIVVTGVTRGLGRALAERWLSEGHTIWGCGRMGQPLTVPGF